MVSLAFRIVWVVVSTHGAIDRATVIFGLFPGYLDLVRERLIESALGRERDGESAKDVETEARHVSRSPLVLAAL